MCRPVPVAGAGERAQAPEQATVLRILAEGGEVVTGDVSEAGLQDTYAYAKAGAEGGADER